MKPFFLLHPIIAIAILVILFAVLIICISNLIALIVAHRLSKTIKNQEPFSNDLHHFAYALVFIDGTETMVMIDKNDPDLPAYYLKGYTMSCKKVSKYTFKRWCTGFDL